MTRVLVVDDEVKLGRLVAEALEADGHEVVLARGGRQALIDLAAHPPDVVVTDLRMPEVDGMAVLERARALPNRPEVIVVTAYGTTESAVAAMKAGAADYLLKPFALDEVRLRVRRLAESRRTQRSHAALVARMTPALVAESPAMKRVVEAATRVAQTDATVLLLGESGTGKSQLARFIHFESPRAPQPLVEVHCSALPEALLESELFGHLKGAYTGADTTRAGHLQGADGGTLFLDEVGEISTATQVKLLRFLQEREFVPVGATTPKKVDVRVVAATNRDLHEAVTRGEFREDFFYRLNVFAIEVPPLRARREDVLPLVNRFLAARGLPKEKIDAGARERLASFAWPGNVRQLQNVLERALILAGDREITAELIALDRAARPTGGGPGELLVEGFNLDGFERDLLHAALERAGGNKAAAARLLGITRRRLYSRLESLSAKDERPAEVLD